MTAAHVELTLVRIFQQSILLEINAVISSELFHKNTRQVSETGLNFLQTLRSLSYMESVLFGIILKAPDETDLIGLSESNLREI